MSQASVMDLRFNDKYQIQELIGDNTYRGTDVVTQEGVEIKLELTSADQHTLEHEAQVYKDMTGGVGFPFMHWFGTEGVYNVLVTGLHGPTLELLFQFCGGKISLKTILLLSDQIISRLESLHAKDYVYGKMVPKNLHIGLGKFGAQVSITNLGYARKYMEQGSHAPHSQGNPINVTDRYASINTHKGILKSYCDDFESWWYVMRHFCGGPLPWEGSALILEEKSKTTPEELFCGFPPEFASSLSYIKSLPSGKRPDYHFLRTTFQGLFARLSFKKDYNFDWTIYKYYPDSTERTNHIDFVQYGEGGLLAQLKAPHMAAPQMENEVNKILHGLSKAEETCDEIHEKQSSRTELTDEQSRALIAAHREVLNQCCDFFFATCHPSSSEPLRHSAETKKVPNRMWYNGIYSLLELPRRHSMHHLLAFLRLAYSMVALIRECVPSNEEYLWTEVLGDLARCYWGILRGDADARKCLSGVAGAWYNKVADEYPHNGRLQHHLGVIAKPEIVQQLFHYSKALVSVTPFSNTWPSLMTLFELFPEGSELASQRYPLVESTLVKAHGVLFKHGSIPEYEFLMAQFRSSMHNHIGRLRKEFSEQSSEIAFILCAAACDFGGSLTYGYQKSYVENARQLETHQASPRQEESHLAAFRAQDETYRAPKVIISEPTSAMPQSTTDIMLATSTFTGASYIILHARHTLGEIVSVVCADGEEVLPFMHVVLVSLHGSAFVPGTVSHVGRCMPWDKISRFVNALRQYVVVESRSIAMEFPQQQTIAGRQLPEDFVLRGSTLAQSYFPLGFFDDLNPSTKERMKERPEYVVYRAKRIWYLTHKLALANRYLEYNPVKQEFSTRPLAQRSKASRL